MADQNPSPKHGSTTNQPSKETSNKSMSQADGTAAQDPKGETQAQSTSSDGQNPATASKSQPHVQSQTPENRQGKINPSAPTESTEGGSNDLSKQFASDGPPTMDSAGETGTQTGKGTLEVDEQNLAGKQANEKKDSQVEREFAGKDSGKGKERVEGIEGAA